MDYEKEYNEALERAKKRYYAPNADKIPTYANRVIEEIFPELGESEDERIRKDIIVLVKDWWDRVNKDNISTKEQMLAWLKKQREKDKLIQELGKYKVKYTQEILEKHINSMSNKDNERLRKTTIAFLKDFADKGYENAVECIDWLEKQKTTDKEIIFRALPGTDIIAAAKQALEKIEIGKEVILAFNGAYIPVNGKTVAEICNEYFSWVEKQGEQKPTWSDEDDAYKLFAISAVEDYYDVKNPLQKAIVEWLKSLKDRVQPKPKTWSEDDEEFYNDIIKYFSDLGYSLSNDEDDVINWLKSLKERLS